MRFLDFASVFVVLHLTCNLAIAAQGPDAEVAVVLQDGTTLVGHILDQDDATLKMHTLSGLHVDVPCATVVAIRARGLELPTEPSGDVNDSQSMFAPAGRPLAMGAGWVSAGVFCARVVRWSLLAHGPQRLQKAAKRT